MHPREFRELVWRQADELYRDMPWRDEPTLYHVLVSELMLQQTQVPRVLTKFAEFMQSFPTVESLAQASLADVLRVWQGLGYNRRAKFLHQAAQQIVAHGQPRTIDELVALPGVGRNTAGAMMNYVYNQPTAFVETNIRTVYFHHFFADRTDVTDAELVQLVEDTMDREHPREWFWALMDYGRQLKSAGAGRLDTSRHYRKQSPLAGSVREVRGQVIRLLTKHQPQTTADLHERWPHDPRIALALDGLMRDGLIQQQSDGYHLTK